MRVTEDDGTTQAPFVGVEPIDRHIGRRPVVAERRTAAQRSPRGGRPAARAGSGRGPAGRRVRRVVEGHALRRRLVTATPSIGGTLFPSGEPTLVDEMKVNGERMNTAWVVGVLMGNRDLTRRLAAESGA